MTTRGGPFARVWTLVGGDLADPTVVGAVEAEAVPRVEDCAGFLGAYGLIDREARVMMSIDLWSDEQALVDSDSVVNRIEAAVSALSGAESSTRRAYEVVFSRPSTDLRAVAVPGPGHPAARVVALEGGRIADPEVVESLVTYQSTYLPMVPGCRSALLLLDRETPAVLGLSIWVDVAHAQRTLDQTSRLAADITEMTGADSGSAYVYEVVVSTPTALAHRA